MRRKTLTLLLTGALLAAAPVAWADNAVLNYLRDRGQDFADVFRFRIGLPKKPSSFVLKARATCLAQAGLGRFQGDMIGIDRRAAGVFTENREEIGLSALYYSEVQTDVRHGNQFTDPQSDWSRRAERGIVRNYKGWDDGRGRPLSFGAEVEFFFLPGLDIGLYPEELGDFVLGFFGADLYDDDKTDIVKRRQAAFDQQHSQDISNEEAFVFKESFDDVLAPFEFQPPPPSPSNGQGR